MAADFSRRSLLKHSALVVAASAMPNAHAAVPGPILGPIRLCFNENPYGPGPSVAQAIARQLPLSNR